MAGIVRRLIIPLVSSVLLVQMPLQSSNDASCDLHLLQIKILDHRPQPEDQQQSNPDDLDSKDLNVIFFVGRRANPASYIGFQLTDAQAMITQKSFVNAVLAPMNDAIVFLCSKRNIRLAIHWSLYSISRTIVG